MRGGGCADGPTPQGECSFKRPPCAPLPTLRIYRGRLSLLMAILILALVGISQGFYPINSWFFKSSETYPISKVHKKFTQESGCPTCHTAHSKGPEAWVKALAEKTDLSSNCVTCHSFAGPSFKAHNGGIKKDHEYQEIHCQNCHQEHKGEMSNTKVLTGKQCNSCHKTKFKSFSRGHPEFRDKYPYLKRNSINFNHVTHFNKHFEKSKNKGPQTCTGCHNITSADRAVRSFGFEVVCAECHAKKIRSRNLVLINLPELPLPESKEAGIDRENVLKSCARSIWNEMENLNEKKGGAEIKKFRKEINKREDEEGPVSADSVTMVSAYLLNLEDKDSADDYAAPMQDLIMEMAESGTDRMAELIEDQQGKPQKLLAGLHPEVLKRAACAWALNQEYEPPAQPEHGGWFIDPLTVSYTPFGHADAVAKSWVEFSLAATSLEEDPEKLERAVAMKDEILDRKDGVGSCTKCHAITARKTGKDKGELFVEWEITWPEINPFVTYSHTNHIDMLGTNDSCKHCHVLDNDADYKSSFETEDSEKYISNFQGIERNLCVNCHSKNQATEECQVCHIYHLKPGFKINMLKTAKLN